MCPIKVLQNSYCYDCKWMYLYILTQGICMRLWVCSFISRKPPALISMSFGQNDEVRNSPFGQVDCMWVDNESYKIRLFLWNLHKTKRFIEVVH